jgi:Transcriptional regulators containing a DNA-binding HTH domain and an aminotransferase domain (MocR family) and their eukaryotic orthologs
MVLPLLHRDGHNPLYVQLFKYLIKEIQSSRIPCGSRLPSKRRLSSQLGISLNTVDSAYQQLLAEGYIESSPRRGMFVAYKEERLMNTESPAPSLPARTIHSSQTKLIDFSHGQVDTQHFPFQLMRKYSRQIFSLEGSSSFQNGPYQGSLLLRQEIARYLYQARGVCCDPSQVVIGSGTQFLLGQLLSLFPADIPFAMENPGFHRIRELANNLNLKLINIPVESDGLAIKPVQLLEMGLVYTTPSHQFPLGAIMPVSKRLKLIKWANEQTDRYLIEDDYDGEFRYIGKPIPSLQGLDQGEKVIYFGTFSKSFIPSLRISYMVLPNLLASRYQKQFRLMKQTASSLNQQLIYLFMNSGEWEHHLNRMRTLYKQKHQTIVEEIQRNLSKRVTIIGEKSGLHLVLESGNGMTEQELIDSAITKGVKVYPMSIYYASGLEPEHPQVLLGYGGLSDSEIRNGVRHMSLAWNNQSHLL